MTAPQKITELWAWVLEHPDGSEGIASSGRLVAGVHMPLIGADMERVKALEPEARHIADVVGMSVKLVHFPQGHTVEVRN